MMKTIEIMAIGNPVMDNIARVDEDFLARHDLTKSIVTPVDAVKAQAIYNDLPPTSMQAGGCSANLAAALSDLNIGCGLIGKSADDQMGDMFRRDMKARHISNITDPLQGGVTSSCMIMVTPDGERTIAVHIGASTQLTAADITQTSISGAKLLYVEGYLWENPNTVKAMSIAIDLVKDNGGEVAFSLPDPDLTGRHRAQILPLLCKEADILFCSEKELKALYETTDFDKAMQRVRRDVKTTAITRGEKGAVIVSGDHVHIIDTAPQKPVDTTGAGDLFAAGFLFGYINSWPLADCARAGNICAGHIIEHLGARAQISLKDLIAAKMPGALPELGGPKGPEPTRYGDWEKKGLISDF